MAIKRVKINCYSAVRIRHLNKLVCPGVVRGDRREPRRENSKRCSTEIRKNISTVQSEAVQELRGCSKAGRVGVQEPS
jgi:hypothetical protein